MRGNSPALIVALTLFTLLLALVSSTLSQTNASVPVQQKCPHFRIAIVNGVSFHFEVLAGLLHALRPYEHHIDVFLNPHYRTANFDGAWGLIKWSGARFFKTTVSFARLKVPYDLVLLVSADYELEQNERLVQKMKPRRILAMVHNGDSEHLPRLFSGLSPMPRLLALAPHVAYSAARSTLQSTDWMLAVMPFQQLGATDCASDLSGATAASLVGKCFSGFAMQGKFSNLRRNYTSLWSQMQSHAAELRDPHTARLLHMNVLGKGKNRLGIPDDLQAHVTVHHRLEYFDFYAVIRRTLALVPSLASSKYFEHKFSSTAITSLSTGTPLLATASLARVYTFLRPAALLMQQDDEQEVDAMSRISATAPEQLMDARRAVGVLREELNAQALAKFEVHVAELCGTGPDVLP